MPNTVSVENNFTKGLVTEYTGLNFPENAAIETFNCEYTLIGDVVRREGINEELNGTTVNITPAVQAMASYVWHNVNGDGQTRLMVTQVGNGLRFYQLSNATVLAPISTTLLVSTINLSNFGTFDITKECTFAEGNGYLFIYHSSINPVYCSFASGAITANSINMQIRDFVGVIDNLPITTRPFNLSNEHSYNIQNQGWVQGSPWSAISTTAVSGSAIGSTTFVVQAGIVGVTNGQTVVCTGTLPNSAFGGIGSGGVTTHSYGTVTGYSGTNLTINLISDDPSGSGYTFTNWVINPNNTGYINTWFTDVGNYPSNSDVWWFFKDNTGLFNPTTTNNNTAISGHAPQGHFVLNPFTLDRTSLTGIPGLTPVITTKRPSHGTWFQGRIWYTGVNDSFSATGDANFYSWSNQIYFSQIVGDPSDFGSCYQVNDPSSETLNDILPTDGGQIVIPETGVIHKLWPFQNGMLVFADNGVWFITGSQGIGFSANDYTITQISHVKVLSNQSFVDVQGLPLFWNEDGIYQVSPSQSGSMTVEPITVGTILSFYNNIPLASKKYARGSYDPIDYRIQWVYRNTQETGVGDRYNYDSILNYNVYNKAFYPYTISGNGNNYINSINYVSYPYISTVTPDPGFKYLSSTAGGVFTFADEHDSTFVDWGSQNFVSYFITGYKVHGQGIRKFQMPYINVFSRSVADYMAYYIQGIWDYATSTDSGQYSSNQLMEIFDANHGVNFKRPRIRGRGYTLQLKFSSKDGQPFDIIGWAALENQNAGV